MIASAASFGTSGHVPGSLKLSVRNSSAYLLKSSSIAHPFFAAGLGAPLSAAGAGGWTRLRVKLRLNSDTRFLSTLAALISTSTGFCSQADDSILRIKVETRAFDWA